MIKPDDINRALAETDMGAKSKGVKSKCPLPKTLYFLVLNDLIISFAFFCFLKFESIGN